MDLIQSRALNSAACRPHYQISFSPPCILLLGSQLPPADELEQSRGEAACGLSRGGAAAASSGALQHTSSTEEQWPGDEHADAQRAELV